MGLHDGVAHQHKAHRDGGDAQHGQHPARQRHVLGGGVEQADDGFPQHKQAHPGGQGQQGGGAQGGLADQGALLIVPDGPGGGHRGDHAGGQGHHEGGGQIVQRHGLVIDALQGAGGVLRHAQRLLEPVHEDGGIQDVGGGDDGRADGDGDGQLGQGGENLPAAVGGVLALSLVGLMAPVAPVHIQHGQQDAHRDA